MKEKIFISHAHQDKHLIPKVMAELEREGIIEKENQFIDTESVMVPGSSIRGMLRNSINEASKVILLWTEHSSTSQFLNYEAGMAEALDKQIIVVVPKGNLRNLPFNLSELQVFEVDING